MPTVAFLLIQNQISREPLVVLAVAGAGAWVTLGASSSLERDLGFVPDDANQHQDRTLRARR